MVFASPSGEFYRDMTNPFSLSGHTHLDNFIVTRNLSPPIGTMQKRMPTPTQTATTHTTGPLAHIFGIVRLSPRAEFKKIIIDKIISALLPGLSLARLTFFPRAFIISICYLINITTIYRDMAIARKNTCANSKEWKSRYAQTKNVVSLYKLYAS